ncbi:MAG: chemotaxis protein CheW [bacterium]
MDRSSEGAEERANKYLTFRVAEFTLAVDIKYLKKVYDTESLPPRTTDSKVVDLHRLTGARRERNTGYWIDMESGAGHFLAAVEEVEGISELGLAVHIEYPSAIAGRKTRYIKRILFDGMRMISEIYPEGMAQTPSERPGFERKKRGPSFRSGPEKGAEQISKAPEKAQSENNGGPERRLIFSAGEHHWSINIDHVSQVINRNDLFDIPSAPAEVLGAIYQSEKAVPVIKPETLLSGYGIQGSAGEEFSMIVLVRTEKGELGVPCERVLRVLDTAEGKEDGTPASEVVRISPADLLKLLSRD